MRSPPSRRRPGRTVSVGIFWARKGAAKLARDTTGNTSFWAAGIVRWIRHPAEGGGKPDPEFLPSPMSPSAPGKKQPHLYRWLSRLVREIFGNPFRPVAFSPECRTDTVVTLARQMYESRDFSARPILADALEDANCTEEAILAHCRGPGPHVRGCYVVDTILSMT